MPSLLMPCRVAPCCYGYLGCCAVGFLWCFWLLVFLLLLYYGGAKQQSSVIVAGQTGHAGLCVLNCEEALFHYGEHTCFRYSPVHSEMGDERKLQNTWVKQEGISNTYFGCRPNHHQKEIRSKFKQFQMLTAGNWAVVPTDIGVLFPTEFYFWCQYGRHTHISQEATNYPISQEATN